MKIFLFPLIALIISVSCNEKASKVNSENLSESALSPEQKAEVLAMKNASWQADSAASVVDFMVDVSEDGENPQVKKAIDVQNAISRLGGKEDSQEFKDLLQQYDNITKDLLPSEKAFVEYQTNVETRISIDEALKE